VQVFGPIFGSTNPGLEGASQKGLWILTSKVLSHVLEILLNQQCSASRLPRNLNKKSGMKNNNSQQHQDDTIPCAQATLTVCDCVKYLVFRGSRSLGKNKVRIHQSYKLIQFVKDLEIFDYAKLLTNGTLTIHKP